MYIPHENETLEMILDYSERFHNQLAETLNYQRDNEQKTTYNFHAYEGNVEAATDMLTFSGFSVKRCTFEENFGHEYESYLLDVTDDDGEKFFLELRHPYYRRPSAMYKIQERTRDSGHVYFIADSFPDFWDQYLIL